MRCALNGTARRAKGQAHAIDCVVAMGTMLELGRKNEVLRRVTVCNGVHCLISMDLRGANEHAQWLETEQRPQVSARSALNDSS